MALSRREARFQATHGGMSSGGWYAARRAAEKLGVPKSEFDAKYRTPVGRAGIKEVMAAKRDAAKAKERGEDTAPHMNRINAVISAFGIEGVQWGST